MSEPKTERVPDDMSEYDEATLAIPCPVCSAAATAKCLRDKSTGGREWMDRPHPERVAAARMTHSQQLSDHRLDSIGGGSMTDYTVFSDPPAARQLTDTEICGTPEKEK